MRLRAETDGRVLYGGLARGVFTTARVRNGRVVFFKAHVARLKSDAAAFGGEVAQHIGKSAELAVLLAKSAENGHRAGEGEGAIRFGVGIAANGATAPFAEQVHAPRPVWTVGQPPVLAAIEESDARIRFIKEFPRSVAAAPNAIWTRDGVVREGAWFHIFAHTEGRWVTPPPGDGVLAGTTRDAVLRGARALSVPIAEASLAVEALSRATSVMAASALLELAPVVGASRVQFSFDQAQFQELRTALDWSLAKDAASAPKNDAT